MRDLGEEIVDGIFAIFDLYSRDPPKSTGSAPMRNGAFVLLGLVDGPGDKSQSSAGSPSGSCGSSARILKRRPSTRPIRRAGKSGERWESQNVSGGRGWFQRKMYEEKKWKRDD
jgi:hypothetical protein